MTAVAFQCSVLFPAFWYSEIGCQIVSNFFFLLPTVTKTGTELTGNTYEEFRRNYMLRCVPSVKFIVRLNFIALYGNIQESYVITIIHVLDATRYAISIEVYRNAIRSIFDWKSLCFCQLIPIRWLNDVNAKIDGIIINICATILVHGLTAYYNYLSILWTILDEPRNLFSW